MSTLDLLPYRNIVVLTGAGMSVASGLPTYRGKGGLWKNGEFDSRATAEGIQADLMATWELFLPMRAACREATPNEGHRALAALEAALPLDASFTLITQNVDGLHTRAGSQSVVELHGNILRSRCSDPECSNPAFSDERDYPGLCTVCGGKLRPDIVLFGEMIPDEASWRMQRALRDVDLFISIGTSGLVLPAAQMVDFANLNGAMTVEFNLQPSGVFQKFIEGPAEVTLARELANLTAT